jgi:hypothetical protein
VERLKVLITVKTYPIPSSKYDELVCTAGVREDGSFVRLYPINFRDLPFSQQYGKYQWIEVDAVRHAERDTRKESYRPDCQTLRTIGKPLSTGEGDWAERARFVLAQRSRSIEELDEKRKADGTSLGIFKPKTVRDMVYERDTAEWKPGFKSALAQARLWDDRRKTKEPPRKVPWKFRYVFECADERCGGRHRPMIEDWEVGALYWRNVDAGCSPEQAAELVRQRFMDEICAADRDPHFYVGTMLAHAASWIIIGVFWPKKPPQALLFD